jgi:hypothetical protein
MIVKNRLKQNTKAKNNFKNGGRTKWQKLGQ